MTTRAMSSSRDLYSHLCICSLHNSIESTILFLNAHTHTCKQNGNMHKYLSAWVSTTTPVGTIGVQNFLNTC